MLKGIPRILSPDLLKSLCEMGHGDKVVIADSNFPTHSIGKNSIVLRCDSGGTLQLLDAILKLMPMDTHVKQPFALMEADEGDDPQIPIWRDYEEILSQYDARSKAVIRKLKRQDFYEEASKAYLIIATGEAAIYANIILQKGVISE